MCVFQAPGGMRGQGKPGCVEVLRRLVVCFPPMGMSRSIAFTFHRRDVAVRGRHIRWHPPAACFTPRQATSLQAAAGSSLDYIQVLRFRDGKHVSFNLMFDRLLMLEQLGLMPASAPVG